MYEPEHDSTRRHLGPVHSIMLDFASRNGLTLDDLTGRSRFRNVAHPRQDCMAEISRRCRMSAVKIAKLFGRDHTTVLHALKASARRKHRSNHNEQD